MSVNIHGLEAASSLLDRQISRVVDRQVSCGMDSRGEMSCRGRAAARCEADEHLCDGSFSKSEGRYGMYTKKGMHTHLQAQQRTNVHRQTLACS